MKNRYDYRGLQRRYQIALRQAYEVGRSGQIAHLLAKSARQQAAIARFLAREPENGRALVDLAYESELTRLLADGEQAWYARAAASVEAAKVAIEHRVEIDWHNALRNAYIVGEANCDGTDEEAEEAGRMARAELELQRIEALV